MKQRNNDECALSCWDVHVTAAGIGRERGSERECPLSYCWWSVLLQARRKRKERMCALSCWLACSAASQREDEDRTGLSRLKGLRGRGWKNFTSPFYSCPGKWPGPNGMKYSHWSKIWVWDQNSQNIPAPDYNLKFFQLHLQGLCNNTLYY